MEASFNGTVRTILVLVALWLVLRMVMRSRQASQGPRPFAGGTRSEQRPKGEVRIERIDRGTRPAAQPPGTVQDADFEEVE